MIEKFNPSKEKIISFIKLLEKDNFTHGEWLVLKNIVDDKFKKIQNDNLFQTDEYMFRFDGTYMRGSSPQGYVSGNLVKEKEEELFF